jgi:hypothetical protein
MLNVPPNRKTGGRLRRDRMVVGFTTTYAISTYHRKRCGFNPTQPQHYVIKFVSDLRQVGGFLQVFHYSYGAHI